MKEALRELVRSSPASSLFFFLCIMSCISCLFISYRRTEGVSMHPTYENGTVLVCTKSVDISALHCGVCVVADMSAYEDGLVVVKRIVGCPGDRLLIREGYLYRNGERIEDCYPRIDSGGLAENEICLADGEYFLLGDNRNNSRDSREFGPVRADCLTNVVLFHLF